jgi:hypothetical protein
MGGLWQLSFTFAYKPSEVTTFAYVSNEANGTIGAIPVSRKGWEVYDITYCRAKYQGVVASLPKVIRVQQVYDEGDFSLLDLPT